MSRPKSTLEKRVAKIFKDVQALQRKGYNEDGDYWYTTANDVFAEVRGRMFDAGILLMRDEDLPTYVDRQTNSGETMQEVRIRVTYWFSDGVHETKPEHANGAARDLTDKAVYKAQTGADKAYLKRKGLMAEVADDPEHDGETLDDVAPLKPVKGEGRKLVTEFQIANFKEACTNTGKSDDEVAGYLLTVHQVKSVEELARGKPFTDAIRWASDGAGTLSPKSPAVPDQGKLPLRTAAPPIEMKIGNKTVKWEPEAKTSFSV